MSSKSTKFTVFEAEVAIYPSDINDAVTGGSIFYAEWIERVTLTRNYEVKERAFLGRLYRENYNADESHVIELEAAMQVGALGELKQLDRFGRYVVVIVWFDEEAQVWLKRSYYGVTDATEQAAGEAVYEKATLRAERVVKTTGRNEWPTLEPESQFGTVYYVRGHSRQALYGYGAGKVFFELPTADATKGQIVLASGTLSMFIEGQLALQASPSGTLVNNIIAIGATYYDTPDATLEFDINGVRVATLGKDGTLAVPDITEANSAPGLATDVELRVPPVSAWAGSIGIGVWTANNFSEYLTP